MRPTACNPWLVEEPNARAPLGFLLQDLGVRLSVFLGQGESYWMSLSSVVARIPARSMDNNGACICAPINVMVCYRE
jgi:hypothetical protein